MNTIHLFPDTPFPSPAPGALILLHEGIYGSLRFGPEWSGTEDAPTVIRAAEGERPVVRPAEGVGIRLTDLHHFVLDGPEVEGGTHGIRYDSTRDGGELPLCAVTIQNCTVHGIRGTHGICVYARNPLVPLRDLTVAGCHVYDCRCGSSESVVLNGNIDGFLIEGNLIHDNNNIGIDMIGFEGTAKRRDPAEGESPYASDAARNGICRNNIVYNICTEGNMAYYRDGAFDHCAGGIYVDGGQNIEIYGNTAAEAALDAILSAPELLPLTRAEVLQILERIAAFHGRAYGWETPVTAEALYAVTESGGYLLRTRIRAAIEYLDQLYQYGAASESVTAPLQQERYDEDETPELSDLDTL